MPKLRLDFWNKSWREDTAFGRTLSGRNKAGQTIGVVKDAALSFVPLVGKPLNQITGHITDSGEARRVGRHVEDLNLSPRAVLIIRAVAVVVFGYLLLKNVLTIEDVKELWEMINVIGL